MRRPGCLVLMLAACATRTPAQPTQASDVPPQVGPTSPPANEAKMQTLQLTRATPLTLRSGVTLQYEDIVIEEIAAGPPGYPAGSGVTLTLIVEGLGGVPIRRPISLLSQGYTTHDVAWFGPYRVRVLDVKDPYKREAVVELTVEEVTDEVLPGAPVVATITKGGSIELGDATMIFVVHGYRGTTPGETSPLLLTTRYQVPGAEPEEQQDALEGSPMRWTWRDHRFTIRDHEFDDSMRLELSRLRVAPLRPSQ